MSRKFRSSNFSDKLTKDALTDLKRNQETRADVEAQLKSAREAAERVAADRKLSEQKKQLLDQRQRLELQIAGEKEKLQAEKDRLQKSLEESRQAVNNLNQLTSRKKELETQMAESEKALVDAERLIGEGTAIAEAIKQKEGVYEAAQSERDKLQTQLDRIEATDQSVCPTCGTELTETHRQEVKQRYLEDLEALALRLNAVQEEIKAGQSNRDTLRSAYRDAKKKADSGSTIASALARVSEQLTGLEKIENEKQAFAQRIHAIAEMLKAETYGSEFRDTLKPVIEQLAGLSYDDEKARANAFEAAQCERYEEKLRQILLRETKTEQYQSTIESLKQQIGTLRNELDTGNPFKELQKLIGDLDKKIADVGFDHVRFEAVRVRLKELAAANEQMRDLVHAEKNLAEWQKRREQVQHRKQEADKELEASETKQTSIRESLSERKAVEEKLDAVKKERQQIEEGVRALQVRKGELQAKLNQSSEDRKALKTVRKRRKEANEEAGLYGKLRRAFGKNGIPSLIIEQTLPEIEDRANELLDRLTDGKMHIRLETLKDKKTGGTRETLEITITDEQGVARPYETYSGGEAFRVNFAIRIALSQMLADRNGVKIRTLGIDEGFGTQDEEGIQNMIEAIQTIQDDFDKILVITHLDRLKEAFPVRIEVHKDPVRGSSFSFVGG